MKEQLKHRVRHCFIERSLNVAACSARGCGHRSVRLRGSEIPLTFKLVIRDELIGAQAGTPLIFTSPSVSSDGSFCVSLLASGSCHQDGNSLWIALKHDPW